MHDGGLIGSGLDNKPVEHNQPNQPIEHAHGLLTNQIVAYSNRGMLEQALHAEIAAQVLCHSWCQTDTSLYIAIGLGQAVLVSDHVSHIGPDLFNHL